MSSRYSQSPNRQDRMLASRAGAVLIAVLVVLLISGLLVTQTIQLMSIAARAERQRERIRQARELVELGRILVEQGSVPENGQLTIDVDGFPATITFQRLADDDVQVGKSTRFRIMAAYGENGANQEISIGSHK